MATGITHLSTDVCTFFLNNLCVLGDRCPQSHDLTNTIVEVADRHLSPHLTFQPFDHFSAAHSLTHVSPLALPAQPPQTAPSYLEPISGLQSLQHQVFPSAASSPAMSAQVPQPIPAYPQQTRGPVTMPHYADVAYDSYSPIQQQRFLPTYPHPAPQHPVYPLNLTPREQPLRYPQPAPRPPHPQFDGIQRHSQPEHRIHPAHHYVVPIQSAFVSNYRQLTPAPHSVFQEMPPQPTLETVPVHYLKRMHEERDELRNRLDEAYIARNTVRASILNQQLVENVLIVRKILRKTQICAANLRKKCRYGKKCGYAHHKWELKNSDSPIVKICKNRLDNCPFKDQCFFAHDPNEKVLLESAFART